MSRELKISLAAESSPRSKLQPPSATAGKGVVGYSPEMTAQTWG